MWNYSVLKELFKSFVHFSVEVFVFTLLICKIIYKYIYLILIIHNSYVLQSHHKH